ncbi:MAG: M23 family metallopeptidase [Muribaculaceae bacterium]|nr:M23 family metallopeptidase [Muribaculaceae bacterium]
MKIDFFRRKKSDQVTDVDGIERFRTRKRYRLAFINENTLNRVWTVRLTLPRVILAVIIIILAVVSLGTMFIVVTPLRTILPGYLKGNERREYIATTLRIDSLAAEMNLRKAYLDNISAILADSISVEERMAAFADSIPVKLPYDSIIEASSTEREFVKIYEEREKYNLSVLSPLAATGMSFINPAQGAAVADPDPSGADIGTIRFITPRLQPVNAIYRGTVIDTYSTPGHGDIVIIQHPNDFVSRISGLTTTMVQRGMTVMPGSRIGLSEAPAGTDSLSRPVLALQLWHKGTPVNPRDYVPITSSHVPTK